MLDSVEVWPASSRCEWLVTFATVIGTKTVEVKNMIISYIFAFDGFSITTFSLHWLLKFAKNPPSICIEIEN